MNFRFYTVSGDYCEYLKNFDKKVPNVANEKANRPFVGIILEINKCTYYAPLTSPKKKHLRMKNQLDFLKINNGKWGAINFNNMIPVSENELKIIELRPLEDDTKSLIEYKNLLINQLRWCNSNKERIRTNAAKLYELISSGKTRESLKERCCNFLALEEACKNYKHTGKEN